MKSGEEEQVKDPTVEGAEDRDFQWIVGQTLTPKRYTRLGEIWNVGKVWLANAVYRDRDAEPAAAAMGVAQIEANLGADSPSVPSGEKRQGLAREEDLLHKEATVSARLFGDAVPKKGK